MIKMFTAPRVCCIRLVLASLSVFAVPNARATPARGSFASAPSEIKAVTVTAEREGQVTHFCVENNEFCEVTMTFEMGLVNLKGPGKFPLTVTFPPKKKTPAFDLSPMDPAAKWEYTYTNYYKLGSCVAQHDDDYLYQLPYAPGKKFKVTQGYNGSFSHKGSNLYATDWQMPEGTTVYAARGGVVVKTKDDSNSGGSSMKYDPFNNFVLIRHDDGTLGHYCHLQKNGVVVRPGQTVRAGETIAHSGNTGFSSGAHLHFSVYKTKNGKERESLPVKFRTADEQSTTLVSGHSYRAGDAMTASARTTPEPRRAISVEQPGGGSGAL
jgi:murein DD-endopeptidase MepM/ murein hydrolase activator NlpD